MNWLGQLILPLLRPTDEVLDLGCGIMQPTGGRLGVKAHVGVDSFQPYLDLIGGPYVHGTVQEAAGGLPPKSFDVVLMLDVVEHLDKADAMAAIRGAESIARRLVVLFTPDGFCPQAGWDAWGMGVNDAQAHRCGFTLEELAAAGYACTRHPNGTLQHGPIVSLLAVKTIDPDPPAPAEDCLDVIEHWIACRTQP